MTQQEYLKFVEKTTKDLRDLIAKKTNDYSDTTDPFANVRIAEQFGVAPTEVAIYARLADKFKRLSNGLSGKELKVTDESMQDTAMDLMGYTLLLMGYLQSKQLAGPLTVIVADRKPEPLNLKVTSVAQQNPDW